MFSFINFIKELSCALQFHNLGVKGILSVLGQGKDCCITVIFLWNLNRGSELSVLLGLGLRRSEEDQVLWQTETPSPVYLKVLVSLTRKLVMNETESSSSWWVSGMYRCLWSCRKAKKGSYFLSLKQGNM